MDSNTSQERAHNERSRCKCDQCRRLAALAGAIGAVRARGSALFLNRAPFPTPRPVEIPPGEPEKNADSARNEPDKEE